MSERALQLIAEHKTKHARGEDALDVVFKQKSVHFIC
jgi:hypothetical protein